MIGCVDNAAARRAIAASLGRPRWRVTRAWWVDCGNGRNSGQVLLGNAVEPVDDGVLRCVAAEPKAVAALAGLHLNAVAPVPHRDRRVSPSAAAADRRL